MHKNLSTLIIITFLISTYGGVKSMKPTYELDGNIHHYLGIELNMQTWNLLGKEDRNDQDNNRMIAFAKGSQYHWYKSPKWQPVNAQRGEWLISRVYSFLGRGEKAVEHALLCKKLTEEQDLKDFDLAYCYEALARAYAVSGNEEEYTKYFKMAKEAGDKIAGEEDKKYFLGDLNAGPWKKAEK